MGVTQEDVIKGLEEVQHYIKVENLPAHTLKAKIVIDDALALLKAQEPMRPTPGLWGRDIQLFNCGACGGEIGAGGIAKYCLHCGRAVKWDD